MGVFREPNGNPVNPSGGNGKPAVEAPAAVPGGGLAAQEEPDKKEQEEAEEAEEAEVEEKEEEDDDNDDDTEEEEEEEEEEGCERGGRRLRLGECRSPVWEERGGHRSLERRPRGPWAAWAVVWCGGPLARSPVPTRVGLLGLWGSSCPSRVPNEAALAIARPRGPPPPLVCRGPRTLLEQDDEDDEEEEEDDVEADAPNWGT